MEKYHTGRPIIRMREYGRYTQELVLNARTIKDPELRQVYIEKIIELIMDMYPQSKNIEDYRLKIWSHILQIADYELDVEVPEDVPTHKIEIHPDKVPYPRGRMAFRHYGRHVHSLIAKAIEMEPPLKKMEMVRVIAAYMKMSFQNYYNAEVSDETIYQDLETLSNGQLYLDEESDLDYLSAASATNMRQSKTRVTNRKPKDTVRTTHTTKTIGTTTRQSRYNNNMGNNMGNNNMQPPIGNNRYTRKRK